jgi:hypothetical protein
MATVRSSDPRAADSPSTPRVPVTRIPRFSATVRAALSSTIRMSAGTDSAKRICTFSGMEFLHVQRYPDWIRFALDP